MGEAVKQVLDPLSEWLALLCTWQSLTAFVAVWFYEAVPLFSPEYGLIAQSFDGIEAGQLHFRHGIEPNAWLPPFVTMALIQVFFARTLTTPSDAAPWPRLWLWALLGGLVALSWAGAVFLVDRVGLTHADGRADFDFLWAENVAISMLSVVLLPIAVWQVAALQSGPRELFSAMLRRSKAGWLFAFMLLQVGLVGINVQSEKAALAFLSGQPLLGYLLTSASYSFDLVAVVLFQVAAFRSVASTRASVDAVFA
jgi:hypothetical protein